MASVWNSNAKSINLVDWDMKLANNLIINR